MAITTYTVKRGDSLWKIAKTYPSSISGNTTQAKINTMVRLNNIKNPNLILVGQVLKLSSSSGSGSSSSSSSASKPSGSTANVQRTPVVNLFGLQSGDDSGRAMYATWSYSRSNTGHYQYRWFYYADNTWWLDVDSNTNGAESIHCQSTYTAPENAKKVRFFVRPISNTYKDSSGNEHYYWTDGQWTTAKDYDFSNNPPSVPSVPTVEIDELSLKASIDNINASKLNANQIEFEVVKNNTSKVNSGKASINTSTNYVSYQCTVSAGGEYKVRCRGVRGSLVSGWSDYSDNKGTEPSAPSGITALRANDYADSLITVYIAWSEVTSATSYDIEYSTNKNYFGGSDGTTTINGIEFTHYEITSLDPGKEYFFRVRAVNENGESDWTDIKSIVIGLKPAAPTTWSSTTTGIVGEPLILYWVHNAEDGSSQTFAELEITVEGRTETYTIRNSTDEDEKDRTSSYEIDTSSYTEGVNILWRVRTAGITKAYGDWSVQRSIDIYAKPTLEFSVTDDSGSLIDILTAFPCYISALAGPKTQNPIGYSLKITANDFYETIDDVGRTKVVNKGDAVYSQNFDITGELLVELSAGNIDLESGIGYTVTCSVTMNSGLSAEISHEFTVDWTDVIYLLDTDIQIDKEIYAAYLTPYCRDEDGNLVDDITLSVYRREFDGNFTELATGITNSNNTTITDPHPALDYARYRIVGVTKSTGAVSFYDTPSYPVNGTAVIIQWDEEWSTFDTSDEYSLEAPPWSGSMLSLPYNIDVSDKYNPDVSFVEYAGRSHPVTYYGTQRGETPSWNMEIPKDDKDTLYALRRLAIYMGDVYVREPSGSGYWANCTVSFSQTHCEVTIPVTLDITRVEGGV